MAMGSEKKLLPPFGAAVFCNAERQCVCLREAAASGVVQTIN